MDVMLYTAELIGVVVFAASGAIVAVTARLDLFGVTLLGVITAVGGGLMRDLLLGHVPPRMFYNHWYVLLAAAVAIVIFSVLYVKRSGVKTDHPLFTGAITLLDAIGLGIFAVIGAGYAIEEGYGGNGFLVVFLGTMTAIGGGMLRDLLAGHVPMVLRKHVYAVAAISGALLYYALFRLEVTQSLAMALGVLLTIVLRLAAAYFRWNLPRLRTHSAEGSLASEPGREINAHN